MLLGVIVRHLWKAVKYFQSILEISILMYQQRGGTLSYDLNICEQLGLCA